jgi:homoserine O-succinyltransferase
MPHSRHTKIEENDILKETELEILAKSDEAGVSIIRSKDKRKIFLTGHLEYDRFTLAKEYERDISQNKKIDVPFNYYPENDSTKKPIFNWKAHANLLFVNWINHYVYQETPYNLEELENL